MISAACWNPLPERKRANHECDADPGLRAMGGTIRYDIAPLPVAGLSRCDSLRCRAANCGTHIESADAIHVGLRGTGSDDGRSARDVGTDAAGGCKPGSHVSDPK